jgi:hypothetical protein
MPNEPAMTRRGEWKVNATMGISHSEFQGSVSPLKYLSINSSYFTGYRGQYAYEYGVGIYVPVFRLNTHRIFTSASISKSVGHIGGQYQLAALGGGIEYLNLNNDYTCNNYQFSIYYIKKSENASDKQAKKLGITLKLHDIFYSKLYKSSSFMYMSTQPISLKKIDKTNISVIGNSLTLFYHFEPEGTPFYVQYIGGLVPQSHLAENINLDRNNQAKTKFKIRNAFNFGISIGLKI